MEERNSEDTEIIQVYQKRINIIGVSKKKKTDEIRTVSYKKEHLQNKKELLELKI